MTPSFSLVNVIPCTAYTADEAHSATPELAMIYAHSYVGIVTLQTPQYIVTLQTTYSHPAVL